MIKIIVCILIIAGFAYVGYVVSSYYKKRKKFFKDYVDFLRYAKSRITFSQIRLSKVFSSFSAFDSDFEKMTKQIATRLNEDGEFEAKKPNYILENEWNEIAEFLRGIGKADVETECENLEAQIDKVQMKLKQVVEKCDKNSALSLKVSIAIGFAVVIIFI